jgi:hypothetical protein
MVGSYRRRVLLRAQGGHLPDSGWCVGAAEAHSQEGELLMPVIDTLVSFATTEKRQYRFKLVRLDMNSLTIAFGPLTTHSPSEVAKISTQYSPTAQQASATAVQQVAAWISGTPSFASATVPFDTSIHFDQANEQVDGFVLILNDELGTDAVIGVLKYPNRAISFRLPEASPNLERVKDSGYFPLVLSGIDETQASIGILVWSE